MVQCFPQRINAKFHKVHLEWSYFSEIPLHVNHFYSYLSHFFSVYKLLIVTNTLYFGCFAPCRTSAFSLIISLELFWLPAWHTKNCVHPTVLIKSFYVTDFRLTIKSKTVKRPNSCMHTQTIADLSARATIQASPNIAFIKQATAILQWAIYRFILGWVVQSRKSFLRQKPKQINWKPMDRIEVSSA